MVLHYSRFCSLFFHSALCCCYSSMLMTKASVFLAQTPLLLSGARLLSCMCLKGDVLLLVHWGWGLSGELSLFSTLPRRDSGRGALTGSVTVAAGQCSTVSVPAFCTWWTCRFCLLPCGKYHICDRSWTCVSVHTARYPLEYVPKSGIGGVYILGITKLLIHVVLPGTNLDVNPPKLSPLNNSVRLGVFVKWHETFNGSCIVKIFVSLGNKKND